MLSCVCFGCAHARGDWRVGVFVCLYFVPPLNTAVLIHYFSANNWICEVFHFLFYYPVYRLVERGGPRVEENGAKVADAGLVLFKR